MLAHNHPSGNEFPSKQDIRFTNKVIKAGALMDIPLVDHLIFTHYGYFSMKSEGMCKFEPLHYEVIN